MVPEGIFSEGGVGGAGSLDFSSFSSLVGAHQGGGALVCGAGVGGRFSFLSFDTSEACWGMFKLDREREGPNIRVGFCPVKCSAVETTSFATSPGAAGGTFNSPNLRSN